MRIFFTWSSSHLVRYRNIRLVALALAVLSLAFSCGDIDSYVVDTNESTRIVSLLDLWASEKNFIRTDCADYPNFPAAIEGTCFKLSRPKGGTESALIAEEIESGRSVKVWISFYGAAESKRAKTLESLGAVLASEFGSENVRPDG